MSAAARWARGTRRIARALALLGPLAAVSACASNGIRQLKAAESTVVRNALFVGNSGQALEPRVDADAVLLDSAGSRHYVDSIVAAIRRDTTSLAVVDGDTVQRIMIRVHGGMKSLSSALDATVAMREVMRHDSTANFYPLFINWNSSLWTSLSEHLLYVRRGQHRTNQMALAVPIALTDLAAGLVRSPVTLVRQAYNATGVGFRNHQNGCPDSTAGPARDICGRRNETVAVAEDSLFTAQRSAVAVAASAVPRGDTAATNARALQSAAVTAAGASPHAQAIALSRFEYDRSIGEMIRFHGWGVLLSGIPAAAATFIPAVRRSDGFGWMRWLWVKPVGVIALNGFGTPSWDVMRRRTKMMFRQNDEFRDDRPPANRYGQPTGAVAQLLDGLEQMQKDDRGRRRYEITLIAHSMGAIMGAEMIRTTPALDWRNIVFMAPATTVREFETGVIPYLQEHGRSQFYLLTLHPWAERRETNVAGLPPWGSLLEWIDLYFANPETELDRMQGRWDNAIKVAFVVPDDVRGRVHFKSFGYGSGTGCGPRNALPFKHGHFNDPSVPYWRDVFWHPNTTGCGEPR